MLLDGSNVNLFIAYLAGLVTFFASCLLPLIPSYIAYISGVTVNKVKSGLGDDENSGKMRWVVFSNSVVFVFGFVLIFVALGILSTTLGQSIRAYQEFIQKIGGLFLIAMGLFLMGIFKPNFLYVERKVHLSKRVFKLQILNSFLFGLTFGFAWTPCVGPVLAVILFWASQQAHLYQGIFLLTVFGLGLGTPFIIVGLFFDILSKKLRKTAIWGHWLNILAGVFVVLFGILLILDKVQVFTFTILKVLHISPLSF